MSGFIVTTADDVVNASDGVISLREAITLANENPDADTITFDASLDGETVTLSGTELALTSDITIDGDIDGDNVADITIDGNDTSRVFNISSGGIATLDALTITGGNAFSGGGISNYGTATVTNSTLSGNTAGCGGGISNVRWHCHNDQQHAERQYGELRRRGLQQ
ncbi:CSLREA domain-containing protein [Octadecabacter sp.]|nr:CSLREA domain-containing protein [Octadecabacter sp.]